MEFVALLQRRPKRSALEIESDNESIRTIERLIENAQEETRQLPFAFADEIEQPPFDAVNVEGVGTLPVPLSLEHVMQLKSNAELAPFGHGLNTVTDTEVREAYQIAPERVSFSSDIAEIQNKIRKLAGDAFSKMGMDPTAINMDVNLYKMLIYEKGGHFLMHRDTEKEEGMFATFILQLPVEGGHAGGALRIKHSDSEVSFDHSANSSTKFCRTLFYADCEHELVEITEGWRVVLAYNVTWKSIMPNSQSTNPLRNDPLDVSLACKFHQFADNWAKDSDDLPYVVVPLAHQYTKRNLSFSGLKGNDRRIANLFLNCDELNTYLGLIVIETEGSPTTWKDRSIVQESGDNYDPSAKKRKVNRKKENELPEDTKITGIKNFDSTQFQHTYSAAMARRGMQDTSLADTFSVQSSIKVFHWVDRHGNQLSDFVNLRDFTSHLAFVKDLRQLILSGYMAEESYVGYLGNEGPTLSQVYHSASLIVWPKSSDISMAITEKTETVVNMVYSSTLRPFSLDISDDPESPCYEHSRALLRSVLPRFRRDVEVSDDVQMKILSACASLGVPHDESLTFLKQLTVIEDSKCLNAFAKILVELSVEEIQSISSLQIGYAILADLTTRLFAKEKFETWDILIGSKLKVLASVVPESEYGDNYDDEVCVGVLATILQTDGVDHPLLQGFLDLFRKVFLSPANYDRLVAMITNAQIRAFAMRTPATKAFLLQLIDAFIDNVPQTKVEEFSWRFPHVTFDDHPQLTEFLHSDNVETTIGGFTTKKQTEEFVKKYIESATNFTVMYSFVGRGKTSGVFLEKTREYYDSIVNANNANAEQLAELKTFRNTLEG